MAEPTIPKMVKNPRILTVGMDKGHTVMANDEKRFGANHEYEIVAKASKEGEPKRFFHQLITFQCGPIQEVGRNGIHNEDLIAIVIDRLRDFQKTEFVCRENALAITKLEEALLWLNERTRGRMLRGVEGTHEQ